MLSLSLSLCPSFPSLPLSSRIYPSLSPPFSSLFLSLTTHTHTHTHIRARACRVRYGHIQN